MTVNQTEREALVKRQIPEMELSDGSSHSFTPSTQEMPSDLSNSDRASKRFAVQGNAIITGGAGTLGLAASRALLEHGASGLALFDMNPSNGGAAIDRLQSEFPGAKIIKKALNVTDAAAVNTAVEEAAQSLGGVNVLCCFAGVVGCEHAVDMSESAWRRTLDVNTTGSFICAQAVARKIIAQNAAPNSDRPKGGSILFTASISAHRVNYPQPQVAYNVSKAAVLSMAKSLAAEWAVHGIRVNSMSPGYMDTVLNEGEGLAKARKVWEERNPMGRMGSVEEITGTVVLLSSQFGGAYITGADFVVDGGATVF
ncbi:MAG: hypothetical protein M1828_000748 [Chrysothrix sp. TS-e1954]|nr:MAG: hypothetical protein M1828_000748 [Chrysothrix sp. TS-e1954]